MDENTRDAFEKLTSGINRMDIYATQLHEVYQSFTRAGFSDEQAVGFAGLMFADDLKRARGDYDR
ncbi:MAG: hypothetical protein ACREMY_00355 [bacterium]